MKTPKESIHTIFSEPWFKNAAFSLWESHLSWLYELGFTRALDQWTTTPEMPLGTGHEVVDLLNEFVVTRGYVNAHIGLTSSDIVDNVRLIQINESLVVMRNALSLLALKINERFNSPHQTVGYTHWQAAAPISWSHRSNAWLEPLRHLISTAPAISAKKFGGPVGDQSSLKLIVGEAKLADNPFDWSKFDLEYPQNAYPLQSSDHACEMAAINWCAGVAAQLHKISLDLRFLASVGHVAIMRSKGHAGSSSMPHKTNPYKWEKVCSICRSVSTAQLEMWQVQANNGLERTLDTSWQLKSLLKRTFEGLALAIDEFTAVDVVINHTNCQNDLSFKRNSISSDQDLTRRVLAGESRWSAYQQMLASVNK